LRNGWFAANRAPLIIARRNLQGSNAAFAAAVNDSVMQAVTRYWAVVQAQGTLEVARASMEAAETTYEAQLTLTLPIKNRAAKAEMGNALLSRRNDLYDERTLPCLLMGPSRRRSPLEFSSGTSPT
jgi:hypothetical protein